MYNIKCMRCSSCKAYEKYFFCELLLDHTRMTESEHDSKCGLFPGFDVLFVCVFLVTESFPGELAIQWLVCF